MSTSARSNLNSTFESNATSGSFWGVPATAVKTMAITITPITTNA